MLLSVGKKRIKPPSRAWKNRTEKRLEEMDFEWRKAVKLMEDMYQRQVKRMVIV